MEEEISYSTLVFKNKALTEQEKKPNMATCSGESPEESGSTGPKLNEEATIYSSIKHKDAVTSGQKEKHGLGTKPEIKTEEPMATEPKGRSALKSGIIMSLLCLGILFLVVVVVVVVVLFNLNILMNKQQANITYLTAKIKHLILENGNLTNQTEQLLVKNRVLKNHTEQLLVENKNLTNQANQLLMEKRFLETEQLMEKTRILEKQTAVLSKEKDNLNWTLEVILTFDNFPVNVFCPQKKCQPCLDGWTMLNETCYLFNFTPSPWNTWNQSQQICLAKNADLVVIDSLEEQKFVSNHSSYYYDMHHGYWLGLRKVGNSWTWVNGRIDTLQYWINGSFGSSHQFALLIPNRTLTENWQKSEDVFENRFICECQALIRSD